MKVCKMTKDVKTMSVAYQFEDTAKTKIQVFVEQFDKTIWDEGILNGIGAKLADAYAGCEGNCELAVSNFNAVLNELKNGNWRSKSGGGILAQAISNVSGEDLDKCVALAKLLSDDERKKWTKKLSVEIAKIKLANTKGQDFDINTLFEG